MSILEERFDLVEEMSSVTFQVELANQAVRLARDILVESPEDSQYNPLARPQEIYMLAHFWEVPDEVVAACLMYGLVGHNQSIEAGLVAEHTNSRVAEILSQVRKITIRFNKKRSLANLRPFAMLAAENDPDVLFTVVAGLIFVNMALIRNLEALAGNDYAARELLLDTAMAVSLNTAHPHNQGLMKALEDFDHPIKKQWLAQLV